MLSLTICALALGAGRIAYDASAPAVGRLDWVRGVRADPSATLQLHLLLAQQNVDILESKFIAVSDPRSVQYGQHMTNAEVHTLVAPSHFTIVAVRDFLSEFGLSGTNATMNGDTVKVTVKVSVAEQMLGCEYFEYVHSSGQRALRTPSYSLPRTVRAHVAAVSPTVMLPVTSKPISNWPPQLSHPDALVNTPESLRKLYGIDNVQGKGRATANKQAVTAFIGQHYSAGDYGEFKKLLMTNKSILGAPGGNITTVGNDGGAHAIGGIEAMLDAEYITALGSNITTEFWGFAATDPKGPDPDAFLEWLYLVANTSDATVPKVMSTSYGEDENSIPLDYAKRINVEFMKAGARGISLLFASGDSGAAPQTKNGTCMFEAKWPAASPYVTAVGGTGSSGGVETVAGLSSGGFSDRWARPTWQNASVEAYLASATLPTKFVKSTKGRGFPDISAQAVNYLVVAFRVPEPVAGTSCASPAAAGVIGLLNDQRYQAGKPPLGFLNPFLYQHTEALNDVTKGHNNGCGFGGAGYPAAKGWDAATGLGTPNFPLLSKAAAAAVLL